ncbi:stabilin-2-like [Dreissena polymorpha]|uniref:EGF-like domain-containing protein n=1 Tax=Dreissena polymorpha TaxID=45954 RepID=A0A9D4JIM5_DREPO|nr:stabilin-2-like [Dreissena polymorpha]KAH3810123.1 hypothetical protein DPMN_138509 [Dreissena polymorpha]
MDYLINIKILVCFMILPPLHGSIHQDFLDPTATCKIENADCETSCRCKDGFTNVNLKCLAKVRGVCSNDTDCIPNAECSSSCICKTGFTSNSNNTECRVKVGVECNITAGQRCIKNAICGVTNGTGDRCTCGEGYTMYRDNKLCSGNVGATCTEADDCIEHADCKEKACTCGTLYVSAADNLTCIGYVDAHCNASSTTCVTDAECISGRCSCKDGYYGDKTCAKKVAGLAILIWAIVVIVVGGFFVALVVLVVVIKCCCARRRPEKLTESAEPTK